MGSLWLVGWYGIVRDDDYLLQLVAQIQHPMYELSRQLSTFAKTLTSVERLAEIDSFPEESIELPNRLMDGSVGIRMEHVFFLIRIGNSIYWKTSAVISHQEALQRLSVRPESERALCSSCC